MDHIGGRPYRLVRTYINKQTMSNNYAKMKNSYLCMSQKVAAWRTEELALLKVKPSWIETIKDEQKRFCTTGLL